MARNREPRTSVRAVVEQRGTRGFGENPRELKLAARYGRVAWANLFARAYGAIAERCLSEDPTRKEALADEPPVAPGASGGTARNPRVAENPRELKLAARYG